MKTAIWACAKYTVNPGCWNLDNVTKTDEIAFPRGFIYSTDNYSINNKGSSFFTVQWQLYKNSPVDIMRDFIPVNLYSVASASTREYYYQSGKISFQFTSKFLTQLCGYLISSSIVKKI